MIGFRWQLCLKLEQANHPCGFVLPLDIFLQVRTKAVQPLAYCLLPTAHLGKKLAKGSEQ